LGLREKKDGDGIGELVRGAPKPGPQAKPVQKKGKGGDEKYGSRSAQSSVSPEKRRAKKITGGEKIKHSQMPIRKYRLKKKMGSTGP